jgi:hypothetical protein
MVALVGILAALSLAMTFSASSASASGYCGGKVLSNFGRCIGEARLLSEVRGIGNEKSVCVGADAIFGKCSGGANQWTSANFGAAFKRSPWIEDNSAGVTTVWGEAF